MVFKTDDGIETDDNLDRTASLLLNMAGIHYLSRTSLRHQQQNEAGFRHYLLCRASGYQHTRDSVHRLRHQVFCQEMGFEPTREDKIEKDEFDEYSRFCAIEKQAEKQQSGQTLKQKGGSLAGCIRLVLPLNPDQALPVEIYCSHAITHKDLHPGSFERNKICEISRIAIPSSYRRRASDSLASCQHEADRRSYPFISIGLYLCAAAMGINQGIEHFYVMVEPRLARTMRMAGIPFEQLGPVIEYHGQRAPFYINPQRFLDNLKPCFLEIYQNIVHCLEMADLRASRQTDLPPPFTDLYFNNPNVKNEIQIAV